MAIPLALQALALAMLPVRPLALFHKPWALLGLA